MKPYTLVLAALLAVSSAAVATAQLTDPSNTPVSPISKTRPVVLGEVVDMTSHSVTVMAGDGERMVFEVDSRSVVSPRMAVGTRVKVEYHLMESGTHHAGRVTPLEPGSAEWDDLDRQMMERRTEMERANTERPADQTTTPPAVEDRRDENRQEMKQEMKEEMGTERTGEPQTTNEETLPRTASDQPLMLVLGVGSVALALGLWAGRRRRRA